MSKNNDYIKNKATEFISLVSGLAEKKIHQIVDKGSELSSEIEKGVQDAYRTIVTNLKDLVENFNEKQPGEFENGDLAISPVDVVKDSKIIIKAGEVFEFHEDLIPHIKTPLYEPDIKMAVRWARLNELDKIKYSILNSMPSVPDFLVHGPEFLEKLFVKIEQRKKELLQFDKQSEPSQNES